ncbi:hypothetical protein BG60_29320 [Caballeronia zhejiangensis]|uniref:Uncharacterized protein n=1 Tax=Caballeronia zhejiangensis TaxID=871203 RepID=A0A656QPE8_9BURK|nr:hypothetical protein BURK_024630 [Burkholderia sp. SJ98]KDR31780.1 hypothetical protein BG60_29320 [Caballeronia zhejiangensis]
MGEDRVGNRAVRFGCEENASASTTTGTLPVRRASRFAGARSALIDIIAEVVNSRAEWLLLPIANVLSMCA